MLTAIVLLSAACNKKDKEVQLDFNITVPANWIEFKQEVNGIIFYWANSPNDLPNGDTINEGLTISKEPLPAGYSLATFYNVVKDKTKDFDGYALIAENLDTSIGGEPCRKLVHLETGHFLITSRIPFDTIDSTAVLTKYFFVKNNYGYTASFYALKVTYNEFKPVFESIISSFSFKN